jgi:hypothetical protein
MVVYNIAPCRGGTHGLPPCAERVVKTATLEGGRCSFDTTLFEDGSLSVRSTCLHIFDVVPCLFWQ